MEYSSDVRASSLIYSTLKIVVNLVVSAVLQWKKKRFSGWILIGISFFSCP